jgi:hypothetical protein
MSQIGSRWELTADPKLPTDERFPPAIDSVTKASVDDNLLLNGVAARFLGWLVKK